MPSAAIAEGVFYRFFPLPSHKGEGPGVGFFT